VDAFCRKPEQQHGVPAGTAQHRDIRIWWTPVWFAVHELHRDLQRETESGLNVVENYNGVNDYIRFGKRGELASNRREEQELGMLCLHILQSCLALINTLMIQDTLALPEWIDVLTDADRRGLTRSSTPT
jgi:hypothetical protein